MSRCDNNILISKVGMKPLNKTIEIGFSVLTDLENCVRINTRNFVNDPERPEWVEGTPSFNAIKIPDDKFGCLADGCKNSGTLMLTGEHGHVGAVFEARTNATEFEAGVITYYVYFPTTGLFSVGTEIADIREQSQESINGDIYWKDVEVDSPGFYPIVVDLSECPMLIAEEGWEASEHGVIIGISIDAPTAGISSIFIYNSIED